MAELRTLPAGARVLDANGRQWAGNWPLGFGAQGGPPLPATVLYLPDINQPECRCGHDWHGLPLGGCPGSDAEGPIDKPWDRAVRVFDRGSAELFHRASEIFPEIFAELSVTFQNLTAAVETSRERLGAWQEASEEQPQTPQQRALPRPSTTPPMWAPRADGRRRR